MEEWNRTVEGGASVGVVAERGAAFRALLRAEPAEAVRLALPEASVEALRAKLPAAGEWLEERGAWTGRITQVVEDDFEHGTSRERLWLQVDGREHELVFAEGSGEGLRTGDVVRVEGLRAGPVVAASSMQTGLGAAAGECSTVGEQRIAVLPLGFPGQAMPNYNLAEYRNIFFSESGGTLNNYWRETSGGRTWATGQVFPAMMLDRAYGCNELNEARTAALAAAAAAGIDLTPFQRLFLYLPGSCPDFTGMGTLGCTVPSTAWIMTGTAGPRLWDAALAGHEAGHNLGLAHGYSRQYTTTLGAPYVSGTRTVYQDPYTLMGVATKWTQYTARQKYQIGWLAPEEILRTGEPGEYRILPLSSTKRGVKTLRVPRKGTNGHFWIECRSRGLASESGLPEAYQDGAVIHIEDFSTMDYMGSGYVDLLDFTPNTAQTPAVGFLDAPLGVGQSWTDEWSGLTVEVLKREGEEGIVVRLSRAEPCARFETAFARLAADGAERTFEVIAAPDCHWRVLSMATWVERFEPYYGTGSAKVTVKGEVNTSVPGRRTAVGGAGLTLNLEQQGNMGNPTGMAPAGGMGMDEDFTFTFQRPGGIADMPGLRVSYSQGARFCLVQFTPATGLVKLSKENGPLVSATLDSKQVLQTANCSLDLGGSSVVVDGERLTMKLRLGFTRAMAGPTAVAACALEQSVASCSEVGQWTVGETPARPAPRQPRASVALPD